jgi:hypothetical protein
METEIARDTLRALLGALARNVTAAELLPVLDAERAFLAELIEKNGDLINGES